MKATKILVKFEMESDDIINFDSSHQKQMYIGTDQENKMTMDKPNASQWAKDKKTDNVTYGKKVFEMNGDQLEWVTKIASNCIRHAIFEDDIPFQTPNLTHSPAVYAAFIASPMAILRGYQFTEKGQDENVKKSPVCVTAAKQINNAQSHLEINTRSGKKTQNPDEADNTMFYKETAGYLKYEGHAVLDLNLLQFMSFDQIFNRYSFNPDMFPIFKSILQTKLPNFNSELGYYQIESSQVRIPEYGFMFSDENMVFLAKEFLTRLATANIFRKDACGRITKVQYLICYDSIEHTFNTESGWVTIKTKEDINTLNFEPQHFYQLEDFDQSLQKRTEIEIECERRRKGKKEAKDLENKNKAEAKAKKKAEAEAEKAKLVPTEIPA